MAARTVLKATDEVLDVLRRTEISGDDAHLVLPEQLPPPVYQRLNKFLLAAGATWNKKLKRHDLVPGAADKLRGLLADGQLTNTKSLYGQFDTPAAVAAELVDLAGVETGMLCLEPSAGRGAIAQALLAAGAVVNCVEIDPDRVDGLRARGYKVKAGDFLKLAADPVYHRVVMNSPFANDSDALHVAHAFNFLKPGGRLVAIVSTGFMWGSSKEKLKLRDLVAERGRAVRELPAGTFRESGTDVKSTIIELAKPLTTSKASKKRS